jgi:hypothetical protein
MPATPIPEKLTPTGLAKAIDVSVPFASQLLSGARKTNVPTAIRIFRATGHRLGPIAEATVEEIDVLERFQGAA